MLYPETSNEYRNMFSQKNKKNIHSVFLVNPESANHN